MGGRSVKGSIRGESERVIRDRDRMARRAAGIAESITNLGDPSAVRAHIDNGICPVCGMGPFNSLGNHVPRIHGISAPELREMAGMLQQEPITSPAQRERNSERGREHYSEKAAAMRAGHSSWRAGGGTTELTAPGREARAEQLDGIRPTGDGAYAAMPAEVKRERASRANRAHVAKRDAVAAEAVRLFETTTMPMKQIAEHVEVAPSSLRRLLVSHGIKLDGRKRRWATHPET